MWNMLHVKNGYGKESGGGLVGLHISRRLLLTFFALLIPQARCDGKKKKVSPEHWGEEWACSISVRKVLDQAQSGLL